MLISDQYQSVTSYYMLWR